MQITVTRTVNITNSFALSQDAKYGDSLKYETSVRDAFRLSLANGLAEGYTEFAAALNASNVADRKHVKNIREWRVINLPLGLFTGEPVSSTMAKYQAVPQYVQRAYEVFLGNAPQNGEIQFVNTIPQQPAKKAAIPVSRKKK
jgi:hypothetical protein